MMTSIAVVSMTERGERVEWVVQWYVQKALVSVITRTSDAVEGDAAKGSTDEVSEDLAKDTTEDATEGCH